MKLYESEGKTAKEIIPVLLKGLEDMVNNPSKYEKLNPENVGEVMVAKMAYWLIYTTIDYPDGIIGISR